MPASNPLISKTQSAAKERWKPISHAHHRPINGQSIEIYPAGEQGRCSTQPDGRSEHQHGLEPANLLRGMNEDVVNDGISDEGEVMQMVQDENTEATTERKMVTMEEDGEGEGDEFDATFIVATRDNRPLDENPVTRPSNLDLPPETPQKRPRGRPPRSKNKLKSARSHPRNYVVPRGQQSVRKLSERPIRTTSDGQQLSGTGAHTSPEVTLPVHKRCSRNPAPVYNDCSLPEWLNSPEEGPEAVAATNSLAATHTSIPKPQPTFRSNTSITGLPTTPEEGLGSQQALPSTGLSAHELRLKFGKTRWWFNDGEGNFVCKMQDQPPTPRSRARGFAVQI
ncbi:MAG: hypothetical protein Q9186_004894 [Xanthomendoza sp. 1 TL-2023]